MMKHFAVGILISFLFFIFSAAVFGQIQAAFLEFDKPTATVNVGSTIEVAVLIDSGSNQISSTDAYVLYDPGLLEAIAITPGAFFPTVVNNITSGRLYIAGLVDDAASSKTGTGIVATITFKGLAIGQANLAYDCQQGVYNSSKIIQNDLDATNIIDCGQGGSSLISVEAAGANTNNITPGANNYNNNNYSGNNATNSALPKTGIFENISKVAVPGMILLFLGGALRLIL